jgi:hypothetical protein
MGLESLRLYWKCNHITDIRYMFYFTAQVLGWVQAILIKVFYGFPQFNKANG